jgi:hypothetical protein
MTTQPIIHDNVLQWLTPATRVRHLYPGEQIPSTLNIGFDILGQLDPEWIWVTEFAGELTGILMASPCHGMAIIWRLQIIPGLPSTNLLRMLRVFKSTLHKRGFKGYMVIVDETREEESSLARIVTKLGGQAVKNGLTLLAAPMPLRGMP